MILKPNVIDSFYNDFFDKYFPWVLVWSGGALLLVPVPATVRVHGVQARLLGREPKTYNHKTNLKTYCHKKVHNVKYTLNHHYQPKK